VLAYDYPLLGLFWTMLWFFLWIAWLILLFRVFVDIFRSHDLGGWGKAGWCILILILPLIGTLIYLIARGKSMHERDAREVAASQQAFDDYIRQAARTSTSPADELTKLAALRDQGVISDAEFAAQKAKILV
jgi:hypothetical protein